MLLLTAFFCAHALISTRASSFTLVTHGQQLTSPLGRGGIPTHLKATKPHRRPSTIDHGTKNLNPKRQRASALCFPRHAGLRRVALPGSRESIRRSRRLGRLRYATKFSTDVLSVLITRKRPSELAWSLVQPTRSPLVSWLSQAMTFRRVCFETFGYGE